LCIGETLYQLVELGQIIVGVLGILLIAIGIKAILQQLLITELTSLRVGLVGDWL
jgi:hypothetical protein